MAQVSGADFDDDFADLRRRVEFEARGVGVGGEEDGEVTGVEMEGGVMRRGGEEGGVFFGEVRLGDGGAGWEWRPEDGFLAGLEDLDVNVGAVCLEDGRGTRFGLVGLGERVDVVVIYMVASVWQIGGEFLEELKCRAEPGGAGCVTRPLVEGIENHVGRCRRSGTEGQAGSAGNWRVALGCVIRYSSGR